MHNTLASTLDTPLLAMSPQPLWTSQPKPDNQLSLGRLSNTPLCCHVPTTHHRTTLPIGNGRISLPRVWNGCHNQALLPVNSQGPAFPQLRQHQGRSANLPTVPPIRWSFDKLIDPKMGCSNPISLFRRFERRTTRRGPCRFRCSETWTPSSGDAFDGKEWYRMACSTILATQIS